MTAGDLAAVLRQHLRLFLLVTAVVLTVAVTWVVARPIEYTSSARLLVSIDGTTTASTYRNDEAVTSRINTYLPLITSEVVIRQVRQRLNSPLSETELADRVTAVRLPRTALIDIQATGSSAGEAQQLAQAVADDFVTYTDAIETPTGEDDQKVRSRVVDTASVADDDVRARILLSVLAVFVALLSGAVAVWMRTTTRRPDVTEAGR